MNGGGGLMGADGGSCNAQHNTIVCIHYELNRGGTHKVQSYLAFDMLASVIVSRRRAPVNDGKAKQFSIKCSNISAFRTN